MTSLILMPCPFCGGEAEAAESPLTLRLWRVGCKITGCLGRMPMHTTWGFTTEAEAIRLWNRRAAPQQPDGPTAATRQLVTELRHLVALNEPLRGGPYQGIAAAACVVAMSKAADALEAPVTGIGVELADEDFLALLQEWEAIASVAPTVVFRDIPNSSPSFEVGKETDTLRFFLRTLRAQVENRLGYPQPPASFVDENFRKPLTYRDAPLGFNPHSGAEYDGMDGYGEDEE